MNVCAFKCVKIAIFSENPDKTRIKMYRKKLYNLEMYSIK